MTAAPSWAQDLIVKVAIDYERDALPVIVWRRAGVRHGLRRPIGSSGRTWSPGGPWKQYPLGRIVVTAGTDRTDQRLVLLHELAHWLLPQEHGHDAAFWDLAWTLYRRYGVPMKYARGREDTPGGKAGYRRTLAAAKGTK